ncbi:MAG: Asp23/Gls24 family envelope stress response protein [Actinomycetota bacterium]|nr:Asp23/Gls24 family envelope stress response protein [Actinomycetota bacterium]
MDLAWPETLACGTPPELLLASMADGDGAVSPAHIAGCSSCRAALRQLGPGLDVLHITDGIPSSVPPQVQRQVLARIRHLRAGPLVEIGWRRGRTAVTEDVIVSCGQVAAEEVAGVHRAQVTLQSPGAFVLEVRLVVGFDRPIPEVAPAVRSAIDAMMRHQLAITPSGIDIHVANIEAATDR